MGGEQDRQSPEDEEAVHTPTPASANASSRTPVHATPDLEAALSTGIGTKMAQQQSAELSAAVRKGAVGMLPDHPLDTQPSTGLHGAVRLRVEYMSNTEAHILDWSVFGTTLVLIGGVIATSAFKFVHEPEPYLFEHGTWYIVHTAVASVALAALLLLSAKFWRNLWLDRKAGLAWKQRRWVLSRDAAVMLCIQIMSEGCWLAPHILIVVRNCAWFENMVAGFALIRLTCLNTQFLWMLIMAHGSCRYRGQQPDPDPNHQLVMDAPSRQQLHVHLPKGLLWLAAQAIIIFKTVKWLDDPNDILSDLPNCENIEYDCEVSHSQQAVMILLFVIVGVYAALYHVLLRRAFRDHGELPYAHNRLSNMYIRIMARHGPVSFLAILLAMLLLQIVHMGSCWSYMDIALGAMPIQISLVLLVSVQAVLLMPKAPKSSDVLLAWLQLMSWTEEDLPSTVSRRDQRLRRAHFALHPQLPAFRISLMRAMGARGGHDGANFLARLGLEGAGAGEQSAGAGGEQSEHSGGPVSGEGIDGTDSKQQRQQLEEEGAGEGQAGGASSSPGTKLTGRRRFGARGREVQRRVAQIGVHRERGSEPMFCMERAVRLLPWAQYAYRFWWADGGGMDHDYVMSQFKLTGFDSFQDPQTDTRALLGWRDGCLVLAFRGTASKANALTDVKAWKVPVLPARHHHGRRVKVHAGFHQAYSATDDRHGLLARIAEVVSAFTCGTEGLTIYLTGHSLGGALAVLAASDLGRAYPSASLVCYTYGSPKVGNAAFAAEFHELVPDSWSLVNDQDPVPRVPAGTGFRRCGLPVLVNGRGDLIVRPTFFERSVVKRSGGVPSHHRLPRYALALAMATKCQFTASKALPGGMRGAHELALTLDLGSALCLRGVDLASLQDPAVLPASFGVPPSRSSSTQGGRSVPFFTGCADMRWCGAGLCDDSPTAGAAAESILEEMEEGRPRTTPADATAGAPPHADTAAADKALPTQTEGGLEDEGGGGSWQRQEVAAGIEPNGGGGGNVSSTVAAAVTVAAPPAQQAMDMRPSPFAAR